jgi:hypothetical protein
MIQKLLCFMAVGLSMNFALAQTQKDPLANIRTSEEIEAIRKSDPIHHFYFGLGPVMSGVLLPGTGTKYNIQIGYVYPLAEYLDGIVYYDGNFNSVGTGATNITSLNMGTNLFFNDRIANHSAFFSTAVGYGGGNRYTESGILWSIGAGHQFFRNEKFHTEVSVDHVVIMSNSTFSNDRYQSLWQIRIGMYL